MYKCKLYETNVIKLNPIMNIEQLNKLSNWFHDFTASHLGDDDYVNFNLKTKQIHTGCVRKEINELTAELNLSPEKKILAEAIALLHDVGRFPQFLRYRTYKDQESENHCILGLNVLRQSAILEKINIDPSQQRLIKTAIEFHGAKELPQNLANDEVLMLKLIRDADKLDVYRVVQGYAEQYRQNPEKFLAEREFSDDPSYSQQMIKALYNRQPIGYSQLNTVNDMTLLILAWVYDINYAATLSKVVQRGYIDFLFDQLPDDDTIKALRKHINAYIDDRIKNNLNLP
jgi:hypothetical protein